MKEPSTPAQRSAIGAACIRLGIDKEAKAQLVRQYSDGRTATSMELTKEEAAAMLRDLSGGYNANKSQRPLSGDVARMRRQVIAIFHEAGWQVAGGDTRHQSESQRPPSSGRGDAARKIDMERVNAWCVKHGYLHKKLNAYTYEELPKLVGQAKKYLEWYLKKL